jgi:hypothetical protein
MSAVMSAAADFGHGAAGSGAPAPREPKGKAASLPSLLMRLDADLLRSTYQRGTRREWNLMDWTAATLVAVFAIAIAVILLWERDVE